MNGWIKLHRELLQKPLWLCCSPQQKAVLITLLLMVNHEERKWEWNGKPYLCRPGQCITSLQSLAALCGDGISIKNVRTALEKFEKWGFLANESSKSGRLITVVNWEKYQCQEHQTDKENGKETADGRQADGKEAASNKKEKEGKKEKKDLYSVSFSQIWEEYPRKKEKAAAYKAYQARLHDGYSEEELLGTVRAYREECRREKREEKYIKLGATFFGPHMPFADFLKKKEEKRELSAREKMLRGDW